MPAIKTLHIRNCRGIVDLQLPLDGKSLIIEGENGTGKSSIIDAIEFLFDGMVQRFEGVQQLSQRKHVPHVSSSPEDLSICCTFNNNEEFTRGFTGDPEPPASLATYFDGLETQFILRRAELLTFVNARPSDRYDRVAELLGIGHFDNVELALKRTADLAKGQHDALRTSADKAKREIVSRSGIDAFDQTRLLALLNEKITSTGHPAVPDLNAFVKWALTPDNEKTSALHANLAQAEALIQTLPFSKEDVEKFKTLNVLVAELSEEARHHMSQMEFLRKGEDVLKNHKDKNCPLCAQPIQVDKTLALVQERLKNLAGLTEKASSERALREELKQYLKQKSSEIKKLLTLLHDMQLKVASNDVISEVVNTRRTLIDDVGKTSQSKEMTDLEKYNAELNRIHQQIKEKLAALSATEMIRLIQLAGHVGKLLETLPQLRAAEERAQLSENIQIAFSEAKRESIDTVLAQIQGLLRQYYQQIHPDEDHANLTISQVLTRRASLALTVDSYGTNGEDPRALSSEGHLDTLGLCIFLAFVKQFQTGCNLLILDDVLTTVDAPHRKLVAKLLFEEFLDKQLIITTHDKIWYQQLVKLETTYGRQSQFSNIRIVRWSKEAGPQIEPYKDLWGQIEQLLAQGGHLQAGNLARQYAEGICKYICGELETPLFHPEGVYQLGDLWTGAKSRISSKIQDEQTKNAMTQIFRDIEEDLHLSNILSHDNLSALGISNAEIETICRKLHELDNMTKCSGCHAPLKYIRDLGQWRCSVRTCTQPLLITIRR